MTVKQNEKQIEDLQRQIKDLKKTQDDIVIDCGATASYLRETRFQLHGRCSDIEKAIGPAWTTMGGHRRAMGLLSTEHLENLVRGNWLDGLFWHKKFATEEIARRAIDAEHRKKPSLWKRFWDHGLGRNS